MTQSTDIVTIAASETPVLEMSLDVGKIAMIVNFLRAGIPSVQLVSQATCADKGDHDCSVSMNLEELSRILCALQRDEEKFAIATQKEAVEQQGGKTYTHVVNVFTVTRNKK